MFKRTVRCIDCGFLAVIRKEGSPIEDDELEHATQRVRDPGNWYEIGAYPRLSCQRGAPARYEMAVAIEVEDDWLTATDPTDEAATQLLAAIRTERRCDLFEPYQEPMAFDWHMGVWTQRRKDRHAEWWQWARVIAAAILAFVVGVLTRFLPF